MHVAEVVRRMGLAETYRDRDWNKAVKVTDTVVQRATPAWLADLVGALLAVPEPTYPQRFGFAVALRRLATTPGDPGRIAVVRSAAERGLAWGEVRYDLPEVAAYLAMAQHEEHLLPVFADAAGTDELAACLWQEMVMRTDATAAAAEGFAGRLAGHALAVLPRTRTALERESVPPRPLPLAGSVELAAAEPGWGDAGRALRAHQTWRGGDEEAVEARLFLLDRPLADFGAAALRALAPRSAGTALVRVDEVGPGDVLRKLHASAASGSVYGRSMYTAYGRLAAWESLAALAGVPTPGAGVSALDFDAIEAAARGCTWLAYTSDWHIQMDESLDTGIAARWPDRRTVALIAATDCD